MSERTELPTPEKLVELRVQGEAPRSPRGVRCIVLAAILGSWIVVAPERFAKFKVLFGAEEPVVNLVSGVELLVEWILLDSVIPIAIGGLLTLLLTKFLIVSPPLWREAATREKQAALPSLVGLLFATMSSVLFGIFGVLPSLAVLQRETSAVILDSSILLRKIILSIAIALSACGIAAILLARLSFLVRHRMTRREVESESG